MSQYRPRHVSAMPPLIDPRERKEAAGFWRGVRVVKNHFLVGWTDKASMTGRVLHLSPEQFDRARRLGGEELAAYFDSLEVTLWPAITKAGLSSAVIKGH